MHHEDTITRALQLYARSMMLIDPIRVERWGRLELTLGQLRLMMLLRDRPGAPAGVLASELGVTPPTITGLVDRLVRQGLVRREEDRQDRRLVRNELTEMGLTVVGELERAGKAYLTEVFDHLSGEQLRQLSAGLEAFLEAAQGVSADAVLHASH